MEFILLFVVGLTIYLLAEYYYDNSKSENYLSKPSSIIFNDIDTKPTVKTAALEEDKEETKTIVNNYYTQNIFVQQNYCDNKSKSKNETKDHSEKVWNELGYKVKYGETYSYKMYGNKIFTPEQVEKVDHKKVPLQLEYGLTANQKKVKQLGYTLVNKYGSKRKAKDILVVEYGFEQKTAKYAAGYRGYENW